jgi:hypothetical protein
MANHRERRAREPEETASHHAKAEPNAAAPGPAAPDLLPRAVTHPRRLTPRGVQTLQRAYGNRAVTRLMPKKTAPPSIQRMTAVATELGKVDRNDIFLLSHINYALSLGGGPLVDLHTGAPKLSEIRPNELLYIVEHGSVGGIAGASVKHIVSVLNTYLPPKWKGTIRITSCYSATKPSESFSKPELEADLKHAQKLKSTATGDFLKQVLEWEKQLKSNLASLKTDTSLIEQVKSGLKNQKIQVMGGKGPTVTNVKVNKEFDVVDPSRVEEAGDIQDSLLGKGNKISGFEKYHGKYRKVRESWEKKIGIWKKMDLEWLAAVAAGEFRDFYADFIRILGKKSLLVTSDKTKTV